MVATPLTAWWQSHGGAHDLRFATRVVGSLEMESVRAYFRIVGPIAD